MSQASAPFIVLSPQPELFPRGGTLAPRLDTLRGKTIAFLDNNKLQPRNRYFDLLGALLHRSAKASKRSSMPRSRSSPVRPETKCSHH